MSYGVNRKYDFKGANNRRYRWSLTAEWLNSLVNWLLGWTWTSDVPPQRFWDVIIGNAELDGINMAIMAVKFIFAPFLPSVPFPIVCFQLPLAYSLSALTGV